MFGIMSLTRVISSPRFDTYYKPDMVSLFASGLCFGVALVGVVAAVRNRGRGTK